MRKILVEGKLCIGPNFSKAEFALIKRNLASHKGLSNLADLLAVAGNRQRLKILYLLHAHHEMCVCDLAEVLELTDSAASQHLRKLKDKNLVKTRREGQTIFYSLVSNVFTANLADMFSQDETKEQYAFVLNQRS
ncbi:MAG: metalloregulator ArsR/SmtB family transcription factor [candidate division KSB1 bacterium]|nr:metalloregulator ArsR/SmtB family transcription factor [candidate division KSB1 bacterium]MDZ7304869.1 metalloregulator ArsR/SmtB family transcription factor [candidate division KSB1 bacterium]MDZ7314122.1 metalloregulator ArsR/SmtB family transcription factor [candidate division KSB1 bacterium]